MIQIGAPLARDFSDPLGVLSDCHRRIERFLGGLLQVVRQAAGGVMTREEREALEGGVRYFREAAPKHTADEEESLFPRLRLSKDPAALDVLRIVDALEVDHRTAMQDHARMEQLATSWITAGRLSAESTRRLGEALGRLDLLYRRHIAIEDGEVFPSAARMLDAASLGAIGAEMACRRGVVWPPNGGLPKREERSVR